MRQFKIKRERLMRAVPTLDLRRKQLNREIHVWEGELAKLKEKFELLKALADQNPHAEIGKLISIKRVDRRSVNIAGVMLSEVEAVVFEEASYSFFSTPPSFDFFVDVRKRLLDVVERLKVKEESLNILVEELAITTQRINLFEKRMIPEYNDSIRYIRGRLEDGERATVMVAKIAQALTHSDILEGEVS